MSVVASKYLWRALAISLALAFAYVSVLGKLAHHWWVDENYSHGLLIPPTIAYILWTQRRRLASEPTHPANLLGLAVVVLALIALLAGTAGAELFIQRVSFVLILVGIVIYFWGVRLLKVMLVPFCLLLLAIPIPAIIFNRI